MPFRTETVTSTGKSADNCSVTSQLSPLGSVFWGVFFIVCGVLPILVATGVITPAPPAEAPPWVVLSVGAMFIVAGVTVIVDFGLARVGPDGQLTADTPLAIEVASLLLGLTIVGLLAAVLGWVAFGSGPRSFTSTVSLPFLTRQQHGDGLLGRIGFGVTTVLLAVMFVVCGAVGVRRVRRRWLQQGGAPTVRGA